MIIKSIVTLLMVFALSCNSKKPTTENKEGSEVKTEAKTSDAKMLEAGFKKGVLVTSKEEGDCPYTIKVSGEGNLFDPINLEEAYKSSGMKVWFKYRPLRMANRCEKASPIEITEIQKAD